ncbi:MAG: histidinol dehydrogenase, partial [Chloroflexi bacterium]|nr:histidinol dehydrogenase [Chloroflexota bacterium]
MRHFQGFEAARAALSRHNAGVHFETSPDMAERLRKTFGQDLTVSQAVDRVVEDVGRRGDEALYEYTRKFDGTDLAQAEVTQQEITEACKSISEVLLSALRQAAKRVHDFHIERKGKLGVSLDSERLGTSVRPLDRVGVYVPGGRACYPSTVLMTVVPARAAGVREVILCTPPTREGRVPAPTLAACQTAGVDRVFKIGGAQAIAAMAFGTQTVPAVDKICGPGNIFVTLAKKKVFGTVAIDGLQGPSELAIVADETANAAFCA